MSERINLACDLRVDIGDDGIAELVFGLAGGMPATDADGHAALGTVWTQLAAGGNVRCVLVRSEGKGCCADGSPDVVDGMLGSEQTRLRIMREARAIVQGMIDCDLPIISAIKGAAVGAGAARALLADISIAGRKAKIIDGHTKIGVAAGDHAARIWPLLCDMAKAKMHLLLCDATDGTKAERIGLVSLVAEDDALPQTARDIAGRLARGSATALTFTMRSLNDWLRMAWPMFEHPLASEILGFAGAAAPECVAAVQSCRVPQFPSVTGSHHV
ncbi:putative Enoyl-CoA hydratase [Thiomonas arsenitoxydans]|uniref:Enoyl-CoA hydratase n=1 Tax=Thiomonas arsenitoxydans (strain DSM 22701 / CIP 110005 / 3As) TaxID=426114 RepID=D6CRG6_THIA3|nr:enoyl-CoA hydratase/isomerase family protein [Thiomonas arsenitoxydans]CAZ87207.1 putative Enoyl-CoA hydratase [Thiomonas arsenitoxydans]CQR29235.1 putative Enoyl-CoA hydratase [Thiomonas arsenitoxydans]CQR30298.1 putative Enoyl-CoA hydratase [Thiomonas arsenitoxydans]CQR41129.1 putative Enoyl-CoA hydratase [Thiomonas arsenitoxydans]CQR41213.1 putative Enoyl-CoA hydratase [Thiomonas arsenitoxydans]